MRRGWAYRALNEEEVATLAVSLYGLMLPALRSQDSRRINVQFDAQVEGILKVTPARSCVVLVCDESDEASPDSKLHSQNRRGGFLDRGQWQSLMYVEMVLAGLQVACVGESLCPCFRGEHRLQKESCSTNWSCPEGSPGVGMPQSHDRLISRHTEH